MVRLRTRVMALLSALILIYTFLPVTVWAAEGPIRLDSDKKVGEFLTKQGFQQNQHPLKPISKMKDVQGRTHYLYQHTYQGIPIYGKYTKVHLDQHQRPYRMPKAPSGQAAGLQPINHSPLSTVISEEEAIAVFLQTLDERVDFTHQPYPNLPAKPPAASLMYLPEEQGLRLVYQVDAVYFQPTIAAWTAYVDAYSGELIRKKNQLRHAHDPDRMRVNIGYGYYNDVRFLQTYTYDGELAYMVDYSLGMANDGAVVTMIEEPDGLYYSVLTTDIDGVFDYGTAVDAHYYSGMVYDFYRYQYNRDSYDDAGMDVLSIAGVKDDDGGPLHNAYWMSWDVEGEYFQAVFYGEGDAAQEDPDSPDCYSCALDVVAHEMTHAYTDHMVQHGGLLYEYQSGALSEAIADIMASVIDGNWTIGEDTGNILRDLSNPQATWHPAHMDDYQVLDNTEEGDWGGVHINSTIVSHAAYRMASLMDAGGIDGRAMLGQLVYHTLVHLTPSSDFEDFRDELLLTLDEFEMTSKDRMTIETAMREAWDAVGLGFDEPLQGIYGEVSIEGNPQQGATVKVYASPSWEGVNVPEFPIGDVNLPLAVSTTTDADGAFLLELDTGFYLIEIAWPGYSTYQAYFGIGGEYALFYDFILELDRNHFAGSVVELGTNNGLADANLTFYREIAPDTYANEPQYVLQTDANGYYALSDPEPGIYWVKVTKEGYTELDFILLYHLGGIWEDQIGMERFVIPGDLGTARNGMLLAEPDGIVNNLDFSIWLNLYKHRETLSPEDFAIADLNGDEVVDLADYDTWLMYYKQYRISP